MKILVTLLVATVAATGPATANLKGSGHSPKGYLALAVRRPCCYQSEAAPARITAQIRAHAVQFGTSTKNITNYKIKGVFRDFMAGIGARRALKLCI